MNKVSSLIKLYHRLPYPLRELSASIHGHQLRKWRYGKETDLLVKEAFDRETWNPQQWKEWQEEHLARLLYRAVTNVPFYRNYWNERRRHGDHNSWERVENWPILNKETLRQNSQAFVADDCDTRKMYHEHTSGTTGKSLDLWWS